MIEQGATAAWIQKSETLDGLRPDPGLLFSSLSPEIASCLASECHEQINSSVNGLFSVSVSSL